MEGGAGGTVSNRVVAGAPGKGYVGRRVDEEVRNESVISIRCHRMNSQPPGLVKRTMHQRCRPRRGRQLDGPVEGVSNERARDRPEDGWVEARAGSEAGRRQRPALRGLEAAAQQAGRGGHLGGKRKRNGKE